jgi:inositol 2-dehydrogenase
MRGRLNLGVIGLGRMGRVYAASLAQRVPKARLVAVADLKPGLAESFAREWAVPKWYESHQTLLNDNSVDAVAVVTPTSTHRDVVIQAAGAGKAIFCEKPISLSLAEAREMLQVVESSRVFLQMGFQRRFDAGYLAAKKKIEEGVIGDPVLLLSTSRDPFPPPLEFCDPRVSGGLIMDMGIHDFDVARMYMGEVKTVHAVGGVLAYPELKSVGDVDNAVVNMVFESAAIGAVHLSRNAVFGYDIRAEIWGTKGSLQVGYHRQTPILLLTREGITHDVVPHFMERFESAYLAQIQNFVDNVLQARQPSITGADAVAALRISIAATTSLHEKRPVDVRGVEASHDGSVPVSGDRGSSDASG